MPRMPRALVAALCVVVVVWAAHALPTAYAENWALLMAGSNSYKNYRHQADVCHSYHVMRKMGFPEKNIIVMMYDDIAHHPDNPFPGNIINEPNGPNVYPGVPHDYNGENTTATNFLNILSGNKEAMKFVGSGRVLETTAEDNIFVGISDHGAPGLLKFPYDRLYATDLVDTLTAMKNKGKFKNMVIYLEACEGGSMFQDLPDFLQVYASTAANAFEPSYATYYDFERHSYVADVYAINWMDDLLANTGEGETIEQQYQYVRAQTKRSSVCQFGSQAVSRMYVDDMLTFWGAAEAQKRKQAGGHNKKGEKKKKKGEKKKKKKGDEEEDDEWDEEEEDEEDAEEGDEHQEEEEDEEGGDEQEDDEEEWGDAQEDDGARRHAAGFAKFRKEVGKAFADSPVALLQVESERTAGGAHAAGHGAHARPRERVAHHDVELALLKKRVMHARTDEERAHAERAVNAHHAVRAQWEQRLRAFALAATGTRSDMPRVLDTSGRNNWHDVHECYYAYVHAAERACGLTVFDDHAWRGYHALINLCHMHANERRVLAALPLLCSEK